MKIIIGTSFDDFLQRLPPSVTNFDNDNDHFQYLNEIDLLKNIFLPYEIQTYSDFQCLTTTQNYYLKIWLSRDVILNKNLKSHFKQNFEINF